MFGYLSEWDKSLESFEKDIEASLKGEVRSWIPYAQMFCERVFKLFNNRERYFAPYGNKLTLGSFLHDDGFCADFTRKTLFKNYSGIKEINDAANEIKHKGIPSNVSESETHRFLVALHDLSLKAYNYLEQASFTENYDPAYFKKIMEQKDKDIEETIQYADSIIHKKNEIIIELLDALDVMNDFSNEDIESINELKTKVEYYEKCMKLYNGLVDKLYQGSLHCMNKLRGVKSDDEFDYDEFDELISELFEKSKEKSWHEFLCPSEDSTGEIQYDYSRDKMGPIRRESYEYSDEVSIDDVEGDYYLS